MDGLAHKSECEEELHIRDDAKGVKAAARPPHSKLIEATHRDFCLVLSEGVVETHLNQVQ